MYTRTQTVTTYSSNYGTTTWYYDIVIDMLGTKSVRNIRSPRGLVTDVLTQVPSTVVDDINATLSLAALASSETNVESGDVTFTGEVSQDVTFATPLTTTNYRVALDSPDGTTLTVENQTTTGFTIVAATVYGSVEDPLVVGWVSLVATAPAVALSGSLVFAPADNSVKTVTFPTALPTDKYHLILTPQGFFPVKWLSKTKSGFTLNIGIGLQGAETVTVGFDVFI